jgi:hypothetical protein
VIAAIVKKRGTVLDGPGISPYGLCITGRDAPTEETPAMTTATTTRTAASRHLALGLERLDAIQVGSRYHHRDDSARETYSVTAAEVRALGRMIADGVDDAYSLWCAGKVARLARRAA